MATKSRLNRSRLTFFDDITQETVYKAAPLAYYDDFVGAGKVVVPAAASAESGMDWCKKIVGAAPPTVAGVANAAGGQIACTLTSASQKQDAVLYHNDQLGFDITKGLIFEARINLSVLPSASGVQAVWGLSSAWIDGPDNASDYLEFGCTANGAVLCRSQDGTTQSSKAATNAKTLLNTDWAIFRIDAVDVTDVKYFIDGVQVTANSSIAFAATGASAIVQPYFACYKPSGTGVATLIADYVRIWTNRV